MREMLYGPEQAHRMARAYAKASSRLRRLGIGFDQDALATAILMLEDSDARLEEAELGERAVGVIKAHRRQRA